MPYLKTSQEWFEQSSLLIQARPSTTRITTKYSIKKLSARSTKRQRPSSARGDSNLARESLSPHAAPVTRGTLTLKSYDPVSGVCLKYETDKGAEIGRLIASLGKLGRTMAALPEIVEDTVMTEAPPQEQGTGAHMPQQDISRKEPKAGPSEGKATHGGGKKKKRGKR